MTETRSIKTDLLARVEGEGAMFLRIREGRVVDELSKESEPFRSTALVAFNRGDVAGVDARFGDESFALTQEAAGWSAGGRPVIAASADDVLRALEDFKSQRFVDEASAKALDPATATVAIKNKGQKVPAWTIAFHPRATDMVARVSGRPGGFAVRKDIVEDLQGSFRKAVSPPTPAPTKKH